MSMPRWLALSVRASKEILVGHMLEKAIMEKGIFSNLKDIAVPVHNVVDARGRVRKCALMTGYVLIRAVPDDALIYAIIKKSHHILSVMRQSGHLQIIQDHEVERLQLSLNAPTHGGISIAFNVGDKVDIVRGPFKDLSGHIKLIHLSKKTVTVDIKMLGRLVPLEIEISHIKP